MTDVDCQCALEDARARSPLLRRPSRRTSFTGKQSVGADEENQEMSVLKRQQAMSEVVVKGLEVEDWRWYARKYVMVSIAPSSRMSF